MPLVMATVPAAQSLVGEGSGATVTSVRDVRLGSAGRRETALIHTTTHTHQVPDIVVNSARNVFLYR